MHLNVEICCYASVHVVKHHVHLWNRLGRNKDEEDIGCAGNICRLNPGMVLSVSVLGLDICVFEFS